MVNFVAQFSLLILKILWCDLFVVSEHCKRLSGLSSKKINAIYLSSVLMQKNLNKACKEAIMHYHSIGSSTSLIPQIFFSNFFLFFDK